MADSPSKADLPISSWHLVRKEHWLGVTLHFRIFPRFLLGLAECLRDNPGFPRSEKRVIERLSQSRSVFPLLE